MDFVIEAEKYEKKFMPFTQLAKEAKIESGLLRTLAGGYTLSKYASKEMDNNTNRRVWCYEISPESIRELYAVLQKRSYKVQKYATRLRIWAQTNYYEINGGLVRRTPEEVKEYKSRKKKAEEIGWN